jgi:2,5-dihydroxypyridine 5,6-dioxygenase
MIVDHPDDLAANMATPAMKEATVYGANLLREAKQLAIKNDAGTDFVADITEFDSFYQYGFADEPGHFDHWGAGHLYTFPNEGSSNGIVVFEPGDLCVLPYNRYIESEVRLDIVDGFIQNIAGGGLDAKLMRDWLEGNKKHADDMDGHAVSHLGWGTNPYCRADNMALNGYDNDRNNGNGRGIAGNFLFSTGPNTQGGGTRKTTGHYDAPMLGCDVYLDGKKIIEKCRFLDPKLEAPRERRDYLHLDTAHD